VRDSSVMKVIALAAAGILLSSCEAARNPVSLESPSAKVQPMCQLGCQGDGDPNFWAPGIYLEGIDPGYCAAGSDTDGDGLDNFCEKMLSWAFRPELRYWDQDDVRREPYWAARSLSPDTVRIIYLLSYYIDLGAANSTSCWNSWGWLGLLGYDVAKWCNGHNGDSEAVVLDVSYDHQTQHWVLRYASVSAHEHYHYASPNQWGVAALTYPEHDGGYPAVYVSQKKHANYYAVSACNNGGPYVRIIGGEIYTDDCSAVNTAARLEWSNGWNVGSSANPPSTWLVNCVESRNPAYEYYGQGKQECYWDAVPFRGWVPDQIGGGQAGGYDLRLAYWGF